MMCLPSMPPPFPRLLRLEKRIRKWEEEQSGKRETKLKVSIDAWESPPRGVDSEEAGRSSHGSFAIFFERIDWDRGHDFIDASMNRSAL